MDQKTNAVVSELHDEIYGLRCDIGRLEQENKKLRGLVHDLYAFYSWADGATHYGGEPAVFPDDRREIEQRMRELGMLEARELETEVDA